MADETFLESIPEEFWQTIAEARSDPDRFREMLKRMSRDEITNFYWTYDEVAGQLKDDIYWDYVDPELSEDGLGELANWVVAQGKDLYSKVYDYPEEMPPQEDDPGLMSEAIDVFKERFGEHIPRNTREWDDEWREHGKQSPWD